MTGWAKAIAADGNGWDGWISFAGTGYGPTLSGSNITGYAWGSDVVGWIDMNGVDYLAADVPSCTLLPSTQTLGSGATANFTYSLANGGTSKQPLFSRWRCSSGSFRWCI
jgi:hypothetical protein